MKHGIICTFILGVFMQYSCSFEKGTTTIELEGDWKFRKAGDSEWMSATVPGCVHTDLLDHKIIPDPFYRQQELEVMWIESADWEYITSFVVSDELISHSNINIQFDGLDTYADVYLNDSLVLKADNMFIGWTVPVKKFLKGGENELRIYFHSAVNIGMEKLRKVPYTLMASNELAPENERSNVFTRKAPFHYGWDWGPRLVTCGVWRPVRIEAWNNLNIEDLYVKPVQITDEKASYSAVVEIVSNGDSEVTLEVLLEGKLVAREAVTIQKGISSQVVDFAILKPELWWTNGLGSHKLYQVEVRLKDQARTVHSISTRIGVRTIELVQQKDSIGTSFMFRLNGVPVFMKGANYIPSDIFLTRNTMENYKRVVADAVGANMNMLRVWGGAVYENDEFYDLLDENGILAWNDFMFACALQPDDSLHLDNIKKEAEYNVKRLRNHPSVALWCGNNENLRAWHTWSWKDLYTDEVSASLWKVYENIFYKILPDAVKKYHPEVSYWPSSPQAVENKLADRLSGDEHDWTVWFDNAPFTSYSQNIPRFVSEYGMQSFPEMKTIKAFANDSDLAYRSAIMEHRQRGQMPWLGPGFNGNEIVKSYITRYYRTPTGFESFVYLSQLVQAEGVKYAIESHRRNMPYCMGTLYWQINDCWPTISWSSVDYFGRWKALHYMVKKAYQDVYPIIFMENDLVNVAVVNDRIMPEKVTIEAKLYDFDGAILWNREIDTILTENSSFMYKSVPLNELLRMGHTSEIVFEVVLKNDEGVLADNLYYFEDCKELHLEKPSIEKVFIKKADNEYEITLRTDKLAKNVALFFSDSKGLFSDNYFDMIPGKEYRVRFIGDAKDIKQDLYLMTINGSYDDSNIAIR